jgi:Tol biopolymer transport system component
MEKRPGGRRSAVVPGLVAAAGAGLILTLAACGQNPQPLAEAVDASVVKLLDDPHVTDARWVSSDNLRVTINGYGQPRLFLTTGFDDFKPTWSQAGGRLAFFRMVQYGAEFAAWKTKLCTIRVDGTGLRELSTGRWADFNPTWTRDGTNQIIFNRYAVRGSTTNDLYLISPDGSIGDEVLVSNPANGYEWGFSGLRDGRIFIDRVSWATNPPVARSFLLTPRPGGVGFYEEIARPTRQLWHKLSLSPSARRVAYMLDNDDNMSTYKDVVLYYADFDPATLTVSNPVAITDYDPAHVCEYPRWSGDESLVLYDSNRTGVYQMYAYRLADRMTARLSSDPTANSQFGSFEDVPK